MGRSDFPTSAAEVARWRGGEGSAEYSVDADDGFLYALGDGSVEEAVKIGSRAHRNALGGMPSAPERPKGIP